MRAGGIRRKREGSTHPPDRGQGRAQGRDHHRALGGREDQCFKGVRGRRLLLHRQPAATHGDVLGAIRDERRTLSGLREIADVVVDTSALSAVESKRRFARLVESHESKLSVSLISFGFKHGTPLDVDMLLDVRFLPNPHYDPALRPLTGHDEPVRDAVLGQKDTEGLLRKTRDLLSFLIPRYDAEGKTYFTLGIGCTGGRHRSVAIVEDLARYL